MYLGIDLGTSSVKSVLMDDAQNVIASESADQSVSRPHDAWSEQDPAEWVRGIEETLGALRTAHPKAFAAVRGIGLSGQQHGATLLDANNNVLRPCILWNDTRSAAQATVMDTDECRDLCGSILFPGFTSPKLQWVKEHEPAIFDKAAKVLLPKDYVRWWLTGEHVGEMSDASGTGWLDVGARDWSNSLLDRSGLSVDHMPRLVEGTDISGTLRADRAQHLGLDASVVVAGGAGDNAASACGMGTVVPDAAFLSLGTSGVMFASNESYRPNAASAVHTFCHALPGTWHQMGVILAATDSLNWWANAAGKTPAELTEGLPTTDVGPCDVLYLPYLGGDRTPINDANARGAFLNLGHSADTETLTRAVLQGVSFAFRDSKEALAAAGTTLNSAYAIGGGSRSEHWLQMLANALDISLHTTVTGDFGASFGAARLGMIAAENANPASVCTAPDIARTIEPEAGMYAAFADNYGKYQAAYQAIKGVLG